MDAATRTTIGDRRDPAAGTRNHHQPDAIITAILMLLSPRAKSTGVGFMLG